MTVVAACSGLAPAQSFVPAQSQTIYLDLDSAEGVYSQWRNDDLGSLKALRANTSVVRLRYHHRWLPSFTLWLQKSAQDHQLGRNRLGLQLLSPDHKTPLEIRVLHYDDGNLVEQWKLKKTLDRATT